jgi:UDP-3-O-[3-hydroxymyristoyl] glucosamine N-acyltransferase
MAPRYVVEESGRPGARAWNAFTDWRRARRLAGASALAGLVPPPAAWAAFGRSVVDPPARIPAPERMWVGDDVLIGEGAWFSVLKAFAEVDPRVVIGDRVRIGRFGAFGVVGELIIEPGVVIGDFALVVDTIHPFECADRLPATSRPRPVRIGEGAVLGTHAVVLPGVTIGAGARVAHHAVVGSDVAPGATVGGYPARPHRR